MKHAMNAAKELGTEGWHKPWSGSNNGNCVEVKELDGGHTALRQSTDPQGPALICTPSAISEFINGVKAGVADYLVS
ncbi:DUF397 domain-containing protein [Streptomyces sp. NPDC005538]|uniref:DUF397 domain-containing protein n=1 Tax=unclassified Streptomyces TaxID=2593676 RepID=UPI0033A6DC5F